MRDEGAAYADRLADADVPVTHRQYDEMIHGFMSMLVEPDLDHAREAIADVGDELRKTL